MQPLDGRKYTRYLTKSWEEVSIHDKGIADIIHWAETNGYEILCADPARTKFIVEAPSCKCYETCKTDDRVKHIAKESGYRPDLILRKSNSRDIIIEVKRTEEKNTQHSKDQIKSLSEYHLLSNKQEKKMDK